MRQIVKKDFVLIFLCLLATVFLFTNLGNVYLWQDEATTAVLAKNTLKFGIPRAFDGTNLVTNIYTDLCKYKGWRYEPWFQFYLVAASFWLLGENTFAARFPFAVFGAASLILCYFLAQGIFKNRLVSRLSVAFMLFSAPFFLYMRQCRWYALSLFFTLWLLLSYLDLMKKKKFSALGFIASSVLLFHSNYGIFFPVMAALGFHFIIFNRKNVEKNDIRKLLYCIFTIVVFTLPFFLYLASTEFSGAMTFGRTKGHLEFYIRVLNKYMLSYGFCF